MVPEIPCLQETNFNVNQKGELKNFNYFQKNRIECLHASGGVMIAVDKNIPCEEITLSTNIEAIAVKIKLQQELSICNTYIPNKYKFIFTEIQDIMKQLDKPFILAGDFNSHKLIT